MPDFRYSPSAPIVEVEIGAVTTPDTIKLVTLIDSGADATLLPAELLRRLHAPRIDARILRTITNERKAVSLYRVWLQVGPYRLPTVRVVGVSMLESPVLGRDVLNHLIVTLNGLAAMAEISQ
jgi:predicted aspartyl protease